MTVWTSHAFRLPLVIVAGLWLVTLAPACGGGDSCDEGDCGASMACSDPNLASEEDCLGAGETWAEVTSSAGGGNAPTGAGGTGQVAVDEANCGCGARICGEDLCGNPCGSCEGQGEYCFGGSCQTDESCPPVDFTVGEQTAYRMDDKGKERLRFEADVSGSQFTRLEIVSNRVIEEVGNLAEGDHALHVENLTGCDDVCVVAHMDCPQQACAFPYIATMGTLSLDQAGPSAQRLAGSTTELVFTQAYYDDQTRQYQILKKAETVCMPGFDFDAALEQIIIEPTDCTPEGTGTTVGSEIADFTMTNCAGEEMQLHDGCGYEALWIIAVADW